MPRPHMLTNQSQSLRMQSTNALNLSVSSLVVAKETLMGNKGDMMGCQWSYAVYIIPEHDLLLACLHCPDLLDHSDYTVGAHINPFAVYSMMMADNHERIDRSIP